MSTQHHSDSLAVWKGVIQSYLQLKPLRSLGPHISYGREGRKIKPQPNLAWWDEGWLLYLEFFGISIVIVNNNISPVTSITPFKPYTQRYSGQGFLRDLFLEPETRN